MEASSSMLIGVRDNDAHTTMHNWSGRQLRSLNNAWEGIWTLMTAKSTRYSLPGRDKQNCVVIDQNWSSNGWY